MQTSEQCFTLCVSDCHSPDKSGLWAEVVLSGGHRQSVRHRLSVVLCWGLVWVSCVECCERNATLVTPDAIYTLYVSEESDWIGPIGPLLTNIMISSDITRVPQLPKTPLIGVQWTMASLLKCLTQLKVLALIQVCIEFWVLSASTVS